MTTFQLKDKPLNAHQVLVNFSGMSVNPLVSMQAQRGICRQLRLTPTKGLMSLVTMKVIEDGESVRNHTTVHPRARYQIE